MRIGNYLHNLGNAILGKRSETAFVQETEPAKRGFKDSLQSYMADNYIAPDVPYEMMEFFDFVAQVNPDVSQTVQKVVMLGNRGHSIDIVGSERACEHAQEELNLLARNAFDSNAGMDWFINQQLRQIMVTGALSQETLPSPGLSGVEQIYQVKASSVRFKLVNNRYKAFQSIGAKELELNPETYSYIPIMNNENSPYALLPMLAAGSFVLRQQKQWDDIDEHTKLWGLMGHLWIKANIPRAINETDAEYNKRYEKRMKSFIDLFWKNRSKGIAATGKNIELSHSNISKNAGQMKEIIQATEMMVASGMDIDPAMLGRSYSTTETYATVCYQTLLGKIENMQRMCKRANEHSYNLHLLLCKIPASCSMQFKPSPSLKQKEELEAQEVKQRMAIQRFDTGVIDKDQLARELGYEKAAVKAGQKSLTFSYNKQHDKYMFMKPSIEVSLASKKKVVPMKRNRAA